VDLAVAAAGSGDERAADVVLDSLDHILSSGRRRLTRRRLARAHHMRSSAPGKALATAVLGSRRAFV
jgi:hypothetical protein